METIGSPNAPIPKHQTPNPKPSMYPKPYQNSPQSDETPDVQKPHTLNPKP